MHHASSTPHKTLLDYTMLKLLSIKLVSCSRYILVIMLSGCITRNKLNKVFTDDINSPKSFLCYWSSVRKMVSFVGLCALWLQCQWGGTRNKEWLFILVIVYTNSYKISGLSVKVNDFPTIRCHYDATVGCVDTIGLYNRQGWAKLELDLEHWQVNIVSA